MKANNKCVIVLGMLVFLNVLAVAANTCYFDFYASLKHLFDIINFLPTYFY